MVWCTDISTTEEAASVKIPISVNDSRTAFSDDHFLKFLADQCQGSEIRSLEKELFVANENHVSLHLPHVHPRRWLPWTSRRGAARIKAMDCLQIHVHNGINTRAYCEIVFCLKLPTHSWVRPSGLNSSRSESGTNTKEFLKCIQLDARKPRCLFRYRLLWKHFKKRHNVQCSLPNHSITSIQNPLQS